MEITVNNNVMVGGVYRFSVTGPDGDVRKKAIAKESPNLITNLGLDALGGRFGTNFMRYCFVGGGNTPPAFTDTSLDSTIAQTETLFSGSAGVLPTPPFYTYKIQTMRFANGSAAGNISEVGIGPSSTELFSRALILDELGDPTTITILPDETLDVTYELRYYPKLTDDSSTGVVFSGDIGGTYDWTMRAAHAGDSSDTYWSLGEPSSSTTTHNQRFFNDGKVIVFDGNIGSIESEPIGNSITYGSSSSQSNPVYSYEPYVNGSYYSTVVMNFELTEGNLAAGIRSIFIQRLGIGSYQMQFDPAIPKTASDKLTFRFRFSWGRI